MKQALQTKVPSDYSLENLVPLCVDLDGTLIETDLLHETVMLLARTNFLRLFLLPFWLLRGRAKLKRLIAERIAFDPAALPYNQELLAWIREQKECGRYTVLATASNRQLAVRVADHLGCFDEVMGSDDAHNLGGRAKRQALVARFGEKGFDYAGNSRKDLAVWKSCKAAVVVNGMPGLVSSTQKVADVTKVVPGRNAGIGVWFRAARVHQWVKNLLVFLPIMTSHRLSDIAAIRNAVLLFFAFGAVASSTYVLNDLLDLSADRNHPVKSKRPFASGDLSIVQGLILSAGLFVVAVALAGFLPLSARVILGCYLVLTLLYSFSLKQKLILDVLVLASLYTLRIIAGGVATHIKLSDWLISFSLFLFLSLAICKRSSELMNLLKEKRTRTNGRFYETSDLEPLNICGICSGILACLLLLLYGNSQQAQTLYASPKLLYFLCPILLYWISRLWVLTFRGHLNEDPILFAVHDKVSYAVLAAAVLVITVAARVKLPLDQFLQ
jgi:4-hydroxybenzoate polyprenyltransferase